MKCKQGLFEQAPSAVPRKCLADIRKLTGRNGVGAPRAFAAKRKPRFPCAKKRLGDARRRCGHEVLDGRRRRLELSMYKPGRQSTIPVLVFSTGPHNPSRPTKAWSSAHTSTTHLSPTRSRPFPSLVHDDESPQDLARFVFVIVLSLLWLP